MSTSPITYLYQLYFIYHLSLSSLSIIYFDIFYHISLSHLSSINHIYFIYLSDLQPPNIPLDLSYMFTIFLFPLYHLSIPSIDHIYLLYLPVSSSSIIHLPTYLSSNISLSSYLPPSSLCLSEEVLHFWALSFWDEFNSVLTCFIAIPTATLFGDNGDMALQN